jgi:hypothetical protein
MREQVGSSENGLQLKGSYRMSEQVGSRDDVPRLNHTE